MTIRALIVPLAVVFALAGCVGPVEPSPPPSIGAGASAEPSASGSASASPGGMRLTLPGDCSGLVPLDTIHSAFSPQFEPIEIAPGTGDPSAQDFIARDGLVCLWGIPNSDAGSVTVFVAPRATASDEQQVDAWRSAGYSECPPFLDACYYEDVHDEVGEYWTVHALVEGFELRVQATSTSLDPLLVVARAAATSMGYV
ncbi:hypothetical protein BKA04_000524 [Cryobacterium mesophilum]|uniref:DUF3558 domain-containing protein n=1 Tax=Terrimesophilobacter mesophilus TaxID=433647 RepID=A0A4R8V7P1_9MICO|nr:hypothetical protein [Terrimesophilobacter mesophilus]MBB5632301.1 hypothetical protein [Terrimesophilobacter mesophilus]TFB79144.1 hypothetical protein E3N84_03190 [Terrimesophilobacter mesophilus]